MDELINIELQLTQEIRRGLLVLSVLASLSEKQYGYSLVQKLEELGIMIEGNTLYPLLRRLENQQLLGSVWEVDTAKPRKYYTITKTGAAILESLKTYWYEAVKNMNKVLGGNKHE